MIFQRGDGVTGTSVKDLEKGEELKILNIAGKPQESGLRTVVSMTRLRGMTLIKFGIRFD